MRTGARSGPAPAVRSEEEAAAIEASLDELHRELGVKRGEALKEAVSLAVPQPLNSSAEKSS